MSGCLRRPDMFEFLSPLLGHPVSGLIDARPSTTYLNSLQLAFVGGLADDRPPK